MRRELFSFEKLSMKTKITFAITKAPFDIKSNFPIGVFDLFHVATNLLYRIVYKVVQFTSFKEVH